MLKRLIITGLLATFAVATASADDLTEIVQKDLVALGYDPGNISGELTTETAIAISKFEADNGLEVTGKPSPQLAGVIKSKLSQGRTASTAAPAVAPTPDPAAQQAAQQACLQQKVAEAQAAQKKKRGFGSLMSAVTRTASRVDSSVASDIARTSADIYDVNATASDLESAAKDLGLTESDIEACRNPGS